MSRRTKYTRQIEKRLFRELVVRANVKNDATAALEVALCYGYGIGTKKDWLECVAWIGKAASKGSIAAAIYNKRLGISVEGDLRLLYRASLQRAREGLSLEFDTIVQLLRDMEPKSYRGYCHKVVSCYCFGTISINYYIAGSNIVIIEDLISSLWSHVRYSRHDPIPSTISQMLLDTPQMTDENGWTLFHHIAGCRHDFEEDEIDVIIEIARILSSYGCPYTSMNNKGMTPLLLAVEMRNLSLIDFLVAKVTVLTAKEVELLDHPVLMHDHEVLKKLLPLVKPKTDVSEDLPFTKLLFEAVSVPATERRLRHGEQYQRRGLRTLSLLLSYITRSQEIPLHFGVEILFRIIGSGSEDLFDYVLSRTLDINEALVDGRTTLLEDSIALHQPEIFLLLLKHGANVNATNAALSGFRPIISAIANLDSGPFFFEELVKAGAVLTQLEESGLGVLHYLAMNREAGSPIRLVLSKHPELLTNSPTNPLEMALAVGYPEGVVAFLEFGAIFTTTPAGRLPVHASAVQLSRPECLQNLELLLSYEAKVTDSEKNIRLGSTLAVACENGNLGAIAMLLEAGADPNFHYNSLPPLFVAWRRYLMYEQSSDTMMTPLCRFEERKLQYVIGLLKKYGLDEGQLYDGQTIEEYRRNIVLRIFSNKSNASGPAA